MSSSSRCLADDVAQWRAPADGGGDAPAAEAALSYFEDDAVSEAERARAERLVAQELERLGAAPPPEELARRYLGRLRAPVPPPASALVRAELARLEAAAAAAAGGGGGGSDGAAAAAVAAAAPVVAVDARRYEPPAPPAAGAEPGAWEAAVRRAELALEAQALRAVNLELAAEYGVEAWRAAVGEADAGVAGARARVAALAAQAEAVNAARRAAQAGGGAGLSAAGTRLRKLSRSAAQVAEQNFESRLACADAESAVKRLRGEEAAEAAAAAATASR
jgi:hypothetical protein